MIIRELSKEAKYTRVKWIYQNISCYDKITVLKAILMIIIQVGDYAFDNMTIGFPFLYRIFDLVVKNKRQVQL